MMYRGSMCPILMAIFGGVGTLALAETLVVPDQYPTIGDATTAAQAGDTVLVGPGWYLEEIRIPNGVSVISKDGASETIVYGDDRFVSVAVFLPPEEQPPNETLIRGFDLSHQEEFSVPTVVSNNPAAVAESCRISNSGEGTDFGVAVDLRRGGTIRHCDISNDTEGSAIRASGDSAFALIEDNIFDTANVHPSGMDGFGSGATIIYKNNTFDGSWIYLDFNFGGNEDFTVVFLNNIFHGLSPWCSGNMPDSVLFDYNCHAQDWDTCEWGPSSFVADPLFCSEPDKEYWLTPESPCIGTGQDGDDIGARWGICGVTGVEEIPDRIDSSAFRLFPNPASEHVSILLDAPARYDTIARVIDVRGRLVRTLRIEAGARTADWDGRLEGGRLAPAGTYFLTVTDNSKTLARRAALIR